MGSAKIMAILGLAAVGLAALASPASAVTTASTYWARAGAPYYWGEDAFFVGKTGNDGFGRWICGEGEGRWWATPVAMDGSTATISAWQRVRAGSGGPILSNLIVYNADGSFFSQSGATTNNSLGSTTTPSTDGYANVESLFQIGGAPNFVFGCLVGVKIQEST